MALFVYTVIYYLCPLSDQVVMPTHNNPSGFSGVLEKKGKKRKKERKKETNKHTHTQSENRMELGAVIYKTWSNYITVFWTVQQMNSY